MKERKRRQLLAARKAAAERKRLRVKARALAKIPRTDWPRINSQRVVRTLRVFARSR